MILASLLVLWALWNRMSEPRVAPFDAAVRQRVVDADLDKMTPVQAWQAWIERYRPLAERGFTELQHPHAASIEQYVAKQRFLQKTLLAAAGAFAAAGIIAALWPRAETRRQGVKETRRIR
jgi:hypothetical protein